ncbi:MAG: methionine--tRNA ligase subunit beta, partial [Planctomycetes bacterium]|nr:methionine--tRNA ligase subunit beta [Planctomycetota bacterium]
FDEMWNCADYELYHFIGKDITYFHSLFFPAMLMGSGFRPAKKLFAHGFLTVNGEKMSKSRGTFIKASTYAKHLNPEYLRYYYASKLTDGIGDMDLGFEDFVGKTNSDLVGNFANLASRSGPMLKKKLDGRIGRLNQQGAELVKKLAAAKKGIMRDFEGLKYAAAVRTIRALADEANRYVEQNQPWSMIKTEPEKTREVLTAVINAVRILTIYLKPILPVYAKKVEAFLNVGELSFADTETVLEDHEINKFEHLFERIDRKQVDTMVEDSKDTGPLGPAGAEAAETVEEQTGSPFKPECTIDDFAKMDLRIAKVVKAEPVEGADRLLSLQLDVGGTVRTVLAGIATAYAPDELAGKIVVYFANLKPRKMKFGTSEGMILAAGSGGKDIFMLTADAGAEPGHEIH